MLLGAPPVPRALLPGVLLVAPRRAAGRSAPVRAELLAVTTQHASHLADARLLLRLECGHGAAEAVDDALLALPRAVDARLANVIEKRQGGDQPVDDGRGVDERAHPLQGTTYQFFVVAKDTAAPLSAAATGLHSGFADEAECPTASGGNTRYHNSFSVTFRKRF